jgi:hypothetical protein
MISKALAQEYRCLARSHLESAQALMESGSNNLIYACLELRRCIESLSYGLLASYRHELSGSALMSWTPRKVLDELQAADPLANTSRSITIELPAHKSGPGSSSSFSGEDRRFSPKWANKAYNKLSNFLHVPTPKTLEAGQSPSHDRLRSLCDEYVQLLNEVLSAEIWHFVSGQFVSHTCDCGFLIKRRVEAINRDTVFECTECGRMYDVVSIDDAHVGICLRVARWVCNVCQCNNEIGAHELREGAEIKCGSCDKVAKVGKAWVFS